MPALIVLVACGQAGDLYLPDSLKAQQLEQQAEQASTEAKAKQLRGEAAALRQRHQQEQDLRARLVEQESKERALREAGNTAEADEALKAVNRIRFDLGQLILQQQQSR